MSNYITFFCCLVSFVVRGQEQGTYSYIRPLYDFDFKKPLFVFDGDQQINVNRYLRYSALTGYREGVPTTSGPFGISFATVEYKDSGTRLLYMYNVSIEEAVTHRVGESDRVIYEVENPSRYRYLPAYGSKALWLRKNGLCFEVLLPSGSTNIQLVDTLLSKSLGIVWDLQKRSMRALVLSRLSKAEKFKFNNIRQPGDAGQGKLSGVTFDALGSALAVNGRPFLDETGYEGLVDLNIQLRDPNDLLSINRQLRRYGLMVREEIRKLNMLVIRETKLSR